MRPAAAKPRLALCPIGKFVFSHTDALKYKKLLQKKLRQWHVDFVDLDAVLPDGMIRDQAHVAPAVKHFQAHNVDALFVPHCNFGTEGAVGMIARQLGVPTLLWGPRDEAPLPDGKRLRDTLCGMFASSKVLHKLGVPFTYIENCRLDDPQLAAGVDMFLRAANVACLFRRGLRIGHVGQRIDFFWTTIVSESELLERFKVEVQPLDMVACIQAVKDRAQRGAAGYRREAARWRRNATIEGYATDEPLILSLALRDQILAYVADNGLDALAVQDFMSLTDALGTYDFFTISMVTDKVPVGIESDVHGAISCAILQRATFGAEPTFLADITIRHPTDDNGVLLWHAGAPLSMKHPDAAVKIGHHWILPSPLAGMPHFRLKDGLLTVARFDGDGGDYRLAIGQGESMAGPETQNNYVWMKVNDWPAWERTLMEGPFIHHCGMVYGQFGGALAEACKYIPGLTPVRLP